MALSKDIITNRIFNLLGPGLELQIYIFRDLLNLHKIFNMDTFYDILSIVHYAGLAYLTLYFSTKYHRWTRTKRYTIFGKFLSCSTYIFPIFGAIISFPIVTYWPIFLGLTLVRNQIDKNIDREG